MKSTGAPYDVNSALGAMMVLVCRMNHCLPRGVCLLAHCHDTAQRQMFSLSHLGTLLCPGGGGGFTADDPMDIEKDEPATSSLLLKGLKTSPL